MTALPPPDHALVPVLQQGHPDPVQTDDSRSYPMIAVYGVAAFITPLRVVAIGLLIHMFLDGVDCIWMGL